MKLSIHLITYNNQKYLPFCLKSLQEQTFKDFSILIIDNCSSDESVKFIEQYLAHPKNKNLSQNVRFIKNSKNIGFAGGHNQAIQWSNSEYVFLVNPDVILDKDYIKKIIDFLDKNPKAGAASGVLFCWDFSAIEKSSNLGKTSAIDSLGLKIFPNHKVTELREAMKKRDAGSMPQEVFGVSGALPIYRREALENTKVPLFYPCFKFYINQTKPKLYEYFDNDFFTYKEDIDLAYRLRLFGWKAYMVPQANAWHDRTAVAGASTIKNRKQKSYFINYHSCKNHFYFLIKNVPNKIWQRHFYQILPYEIGKLVYLAFLEQKTLGALKELVKNFSKMIKKRTYIQKKIKKNAWQNIEKWI